MSLDPHPPTNGISTGSAVFAWLIRMIDTQTDYDATCIETARQPVLEMQVENRVLTSNKKTTLIDKKQNYNNSGTKIN